MPIFCDTVLPIQPLSSILFTLDLPTLMPHLLLPYFCRRPASPHLTGIILYWQTTFVFINCATGLTGVICHIILSRLPQYTLTLAQTTFLGCCTRYTCYSAVRRHAAARRCSTRHDRETSADATRSSQGQTKIPVQLLNVSGRGSTIRLWLLQRLRTLSRSPAAITLRQRLAWTTPCV